MREATITPHLMKTRMKRSGQSEPTCNSLLPIKMTKTENLLDIIMRFLTSLSQSIIPTAHRDTEIENPCRQKAHATEKDRDGIIEGWRKTLVAHGNRREKSIWCLLDVGGGCRAGAIWQRGGSPHPFSRGSTDGF